MNFPKGIKFAEVFECSVYFWLKYIKKELLFKSFFYVKVLNIGRTILFVQNNSLNKLQYKKELFSIICWFYQ